MNTKYDLPDELQLISAPQVRRAWKLCENTLRNLEKTGKLRPLRINKRRYYTRAALLAFLNEASQAKPTSVPWAKPTEVTNANTSIETKGQVQQ